MLTSRIALLASLASFCSTMRAIAPPRLAHDAAVAVRIVELDRQQADAARPRRRDRRFSVAARISGTSP